MNKNFYNQYFILIKKNFLLFKAFDESKNIIFTKEIYINDNSIDNILNSIENFLKKNILEIETKLRDFIKEVFVIFESDLFFVAASSIKYDFKKQEFELNKINESLLETRNQFIKYSPKDKIIHMIINKYTLNETEYDNFPENVKIDDLVIQVNFICLNNQVVENFKKVFSQYEISINKILSYNHLQMIDGYNSTDIFKLANQSVEGFYKNEIFLVKKIPKNQGFFEKFFNFFS